MTDPEAQYHPPHVHMDGHAFDDAGTRVLVTWPNYGDEDPEATGASRAALEALDAVRRCLCLVIETGHHDSARTRAAALGVLLNLYPSPLEASRRLGIAKSTLTRAIAAMRTELLRTTAPISRDSHSPENERQN